MDNISARGLRIGDILKEYGYISDEDLGAALAYQKENKGQRLGNILIEFGYITEDQLLVALAQRLSLRVTDISDISINIEAVHKIPKQLAEKYCLIAVDVKDDVLTVIVNDPINFYAIEDIRQLTGMQLDIALCKKEPIENAIAYYYAEVEAKKAADAVNVTPGTESTELLEDFGTDEETPVINLLNSLVRRAYTTGASDIHIEPFEGKTVVRMRIDGVIIEYVTLKKSIHSSLIARIKILSELDIAEKRLPQDGHFRMNVDAFPLNIRVSLMPTVFGEKAVLRLLASTGKINNTSHYGMDEHSYEKFSHMLKAPNGIIYITGPTGSGKTTTLYMALEDLSSQPVNISTIEDPVEKNLPKINQMQVNSSIGLTFDSGLRALLRQDPDIIMVGETRDAETASISVRSAITGHLVLSTLHTNDAASTITRLKDMGVEPYLIANSLIGVVAQRLMRRVCPNCAEEYIYSGDIAELNGIKLRRSKGCNLCNYTGYHGRIAIHEILLMDKAVKKMISNDATAEDIKEYAVKNQEMKSLRECAVSLVQSGATSVEELMKVAYYSE